MRRILIAIGCCPVALLVAAAAKPYGQRLSLDNQRAAVSRGLPYLARQTGHWIERNKCTSCHQVPYALWAMNQARSAGFTVDDRLAEWNRWSVGFVLEEADQPKGEGQGPQGRADELYQMLFSGAASESSAGQGASVESRERLVSLLFKGRDQDGHWHAGGQLPGQKRPKAETDEVTTLWSLLALRSYGDNTNVEEVRARELASLDAESTSLEHLMLRYLLALGSGRPSQAVALQDQILAHQNDDGGWGWLLHVQSDAMATGQALYALARMEPDRRREPIRRAQQFLVQTQQADGSWQVPSTLEEKHGQPYVVSNDWGTAWAIIGLTRTIDRSVGMLKSDYTNESIPSP